VADRYASVAMTLSDPNPGFKVIYLYTYKSNISKTVSWGQSYCKTLIGNRTNISNGTMFGDPSRGFVSIS